MVGRAVRQADHRDETRHNSSCDAGCGLRKKTRGPGHSPTEQDHRGRVHGNTILPQRVLTLNRLWINTRRWMRRWSTQETLGVSCSRPSGKRSGMTFSTDIQTAAYASAEAVFVLFDLAMR